ncbi:hypothetical protein [Psychrobacter jeotgali]|uniref:hypothetical protein n=1 Tax=Psychrobacter jeotgali TaxID=179010 RepID=UPI001918A948|nr:hypothetical protein [Psychrobacter jeotgali]
MSMIGVSVASNKSLQLEATQEAYNNQIGRLNTFLIKDDTHEEIVMAKMVKLTQQEATLSQFSAVELGKMCSGIKQNIDGFLAGLNEQTVTA